VSRRWRGRTGEVSDFTRARSGSTAARYRAPSCADASLELSAAPAPPDDSRRVGTRRPRHDRRVLGSRCQSFGPAPPARLADGDKRLSAEGPASSDIRQDPLREQRAISNAATVIAVGIGLTVTYLGVFAVAWLMAHGLFGDALLESWVGQSSGSLVLLRTQLAALTASISVVIGALGASFEPYGYFRHVTQIDDEI